MKRSKTTHAAGSSTTPLMMRSSSSIPSRGSNLNPFVAKASYHVTPPAPVGNTAQAAGPGLLSGYFNQTQFQLPMNVFMEDLPVQPQLGDVGREMNIADFLLMRGEDKFQATSPIAIPPATLLSPHEQEQYHSSSIPSACGSMTSGPTSGTAPMSRCESTLNDDASISNQFSEMVRIQSQQSTQSHFRPDGFRHGQMSNYQPLLGKRPSDASDLLSMRADSFPDLYSYPSSAPADSQRSQHQHAMGQSLSQSSFQSTSSAELSPGYDLNAPYLAQYINMERSASRDSARSNASLHHRAKEALARQNVNAAKFQHLQPKPAASALTHDAAESAHSTGRGGKAAIAKAKYERPKYPKVMCNQCDEHPEGFRGEHELRRHSDAKHKMVVKKWICRDPDLYGIPHSETAVRALKDCKQCSQEKQYGAYYNAAAHLRRTHFKVKPRKGAGGARNGPGSSGKLDEEEKRGGKGGGDWPSMGELKLWMVEVTVAVDQAEPLALDENESVGFLEAEELEGELADSQYTQLGLAANSDGFGMDVFAGVGGGFNHGVDSGVSFRSDQGELGSQVSDMFRLNPDFHSSPFHDVPISSAGFNYSRGLEPSMPPHMASSLMSIDSHGYTSPVSSAATVTHAGGFADHMHLAPTMQALSDDLAELPFELTFTTVGQ